MKKIRPNDIKEYVIGEHCFGPVLEVNGVDYEDLDKEAVLDFINYMLEHDINGQSLLRELFERAIENLQYDCQDSDSSTCDQCGHPCHTSKYVAI